MVTSFPFTGSQCLPACARSGGRVCALLCLTLAVSLLPAAAHAQSRPAAGSYAEEREPGVADSAPVPGLREAPRGNGRNLSPAQRDAIRRLSHEERDALARPRGPAGVAPMPAPATAPASRLSADERRQLRAQIREEHEMRRDRFAGRHP